MTTRFAGSAPLPHGSRRPGSSWRWLLVSTGLFLLGCASAPAPDASRSAATTVTPPQSAVTANVGRGLFEVDRRNGNCHIQLSGPLDDYTARSLRLVMSDLDKLACRSKRVLIDLQDGLVGSAMTVGSIIKNRNYDTQLMPGSTCLTPCLLVFAAGQQRIMLRSVPATRIGFSQIPPDEDFGRRVCESELTRAQVQGLSRYLRAMLAAPVADTVLQKISAATCKGAQYIGSEAAVALGLASELR